MGPAITGQTRPSRTLGDYIEGENASPGNNIFAYQVFDQAGNDRIATCPFTDGVTPCN